MIYDGMDTHGNDHTKNVNVVMPVLAIIVPCFNEEAVFGFCLHELNQVLESLISKRLIDKGSYILFVDDGSRDNTWELIRLAAQNNKKIKGIKLSRNRGHQIALLAGLKESISDISISIDADLQDDISGIEKMILEYLKGNDVVYGVRNDRATDTVFKRRTAEIFYNTMKWMGVEQIPHHADYRLLTNRAKLSLLSFKEQSPYLRGLIPLVGYKSSKVFYARSARAAGESKYPLKKMLSLAIDGITSLTVTPLRIIAFFGLFISFISILGALYAILQKIIGHPVEGWASVMIAIFFLGGVQMLSLGVIGEYIGKIYMEAKERPKYFIEQKTDNKDDSI